MGGGRWPQAASRRRGTRTPRGRRRRQERWTRRATVAALPIPEPSLLELTPLDIAAGLPLGWRDDGFDLPSAEGTPREAFERAVLGGLRRPPCVVSFSGGRDSSAVLAVATDLARRHGLDLPVPITKRYPGVSAAEESEWQELVVRHLGLDEWVIYEPGADAELLGPVATDVLRAHGVMWPANTHLHVGVLERAVGGALLTGVDGDGILGAWRWLDLWRLRHHRGEARPRHLAWAAHALMPVALRRAITRARADFDLPWLQPAARDAVVAARVDEVATHPVRWAARVRWFAGTRRLQAVIESMDVVAHDRDVVVRHPFADPGFLAAAAATHPLAGFGDRTDAMRELFGDLLPEPVLSRTSKAVFNPVIWGPITREFITTWDGAGVDTTLVDPDRLAAEWQEPWPDVRSELLVHTVWLAQNGG